MSLHNYIDDETKHRKRKRKSVHKSDHKHDYKLVSQEETSMVNGSITIEVCDLCGKVKKELWAGSKSLGKLK